MKKQERKENANKGFSLVELIVVVAIMAVLLVVLTPQYLRYVERTRLQKDNTAIGEIANAIKLSLADEIINTGTNLPITVTFGTDANGNQQIEFSDANFGTGLAEELAATIGATYETSSNTYRNPTDAAHTLTLSITENNGIPVVDITSGWMDSVTATPGTHPFH